ncbi:hypothetical protein K437DRAFT_168789 [Tilletiaria anomala UBC 951]|uniref:Neutral ceramidase n=1 Tax=Tilletiaria anomala (strain ATCC 24038 / CBS 436.72 / UBC 951) TaxID=1037660 RepID=A0A066VNW3_TILAU|nr:uncharacterized protein K437DRAFT_168789 [Tilletiaria anomala UBC 951]KDN41988.1 hypothetical protein K437DRAFT_168789 [Tilletiaria anomala UBC 951]
MSVSQYQALDSCESADIPHARQAHDTLPRTPRFTVAAAATAAHPDQPYRGELLAQQPADVEVEVEDEDNEYEEEKALLPSSYAQHSSTSSTWHKAANALPRKRRPSRRFRLLLVAICTLLPVSLVLLLFSPASVCRHIRTGVSSSLHDFFGDADSTTASYASHFFVDSAVSDVDEQAKKGRVSVKKDATPAATAPSPVIAFGTGIGDVTGPIVQTNMMGYASLPQVNTGLHTRNRARAFIVGSSTSTIPVQSPPLPPDVPQSADAVKSDPGGYPDPYDGLADRWLFLNTDLCMGDTAIRRGVIAKLRDAFPGVYGERNVAFVGTHSHSGIAGFHNNLLPTVTSSGVVMENYDAIVAGAFAAAVRAHNDFEARRTRVTTASAASLKLSFGNVTLKDAHVNRSPYSYLFNPADERARYDSNQEDEFGLLKFEEGEEAKAMLSWYAVHGTSLNENNTLTSTDNKGLAALWMEQAMDPNALPGRSSFVAGFSQSQVGDTSPNTLGAFCPDGSPCDFKTSTCNTGALGANETQTCLARGPGFGDEVARALSPTGGYDWKSNEIIAQYQVDAAKSILGSDNLIDVVGAVKSVKMNVDMSSYKFTLANGSEVHTCPAALGFGFAGGTTDGPGAFDFRQGTNDTDHADPFFNIISHLIRPPNRKQTACQAPKRILLDTGELKIPYPWSPNTVETQILQAGNLFITVMPGEFTTMSGRRLKDAVRAAIIANDVHSNPIVMLSGPANTYGHYIATREEYTSQRYEGSSTLYGQFTLEAYIDIYTKTLVPALKDQAPDPPKGNMVAINIAKALSFHSPVVYDNPPPLKHFGDVLKQPHATYTVNSNDPARNNVTVSFVGANPRNNLRLDSTFFEVQQQAGNGSWLVVRTDGHHTTTMRWTQTNGLIGSSRVDIAWAIEKDTPVGTYRIVYYGSSKTPITGTIKDFTGTSQTFTLQ